MAIRSNEGAKQICQNVILIKKSVYHQELVLEEIGESREEPSGFHLQVTGAASTITQLLPGDVGPTLPATVGQAKITGKLLMTASARRLKN